jgi:hypothetical protein
MSRRRGELTSGRMNREWPHQVALPADHLLGKHYDVTYGFCRGLSLCPRGHTVRRDDVTYSVFCFADPTHADPFRERFNSERFDPKDVSWGADGRLWRKK